MSQPVPRTQVDNLREGLRSIRTRPAPGMLMHQGPGGTTSRPNPLFRTPTPYNPDVWPFKMTKASNTTLVGLVGSVNSITSELDGETWVSSVTTLTVSNVTTHILLEWDYDIITRVTTNVNVKESNAGPPSPARTGDSYHCEATIATLTWDGSTLTAMTPYLFGSIEAQVWGGDLNKWYL